MKKNNPGCDCCGQECDRCLFKCDGDLCPVICGFRINIVPPDTIASFHGEDCPPPIEAQTCADEAPCNVCYDLFDLVFPLSYAMSGWTVRQFDPPGYFSCDNSGFRYEMISSRNCWSSSNYACPYEWESEYQFFFPLCTSGIEIDEAKIELVNIWNTETKCGTITFTIEIKIFAPRCIESPILPQRRATFTYLYELDYCTCEEMLQPVPFVSLTAENPFDLPEPCNLDEATINLVSKETWLDCPGCLCFECIQDNTLLLSVDGPGFSGTVPLRGIASGITADCVYIGSVQIECGGQTRFLVIGVYINCLDCEFYDLNLEASINLPGEDQESGLWKVDNYSCGDATFSPVSYTPGTQDCNLDDYTFSL